MRPLGPGVWALALLLPALAAPYWPMRGHDLRASGHAPLLGLEEVRRGLRLRFAFLLEGGALGGAAVGEDRIYVGDARGNLLVPTRLGLYASGPG